jgi:hypothetical protein
MDLRSTADQARRGRSRLVGTKIFSSLVGNGCIVVAGCSTATLDLTNMLFWGTGEITDSVLFSALLARCESWNLSQQVQKNKGKSNSTTCCYQRSDHELG